MAQKDTNNSKSYYDKKYLTYNQVTKDYEVYILSEDEYNQLPKQQQKEVRYMILIKKSKSNPPEPKGPPTWFSYWIEHGFKQEIANLKLYVDQKIDEVKLYVDQKIDQVRHELAKTNARLDNIVKKKQFKRINFQSKIVAHKLN